MGSNYRETVQTQSITLQIKYDIAVAALQAIAGVEGASLWEDDRDAAAYEMVNMANEALVKLQSYPYEPPERKPSAGLT